MNCDEICVFANFSVSLLMGAFFHYLSLFSLIVISILLSLLKNIDFIKKNKKCTLKKEEEKEKKKKKKKF